MIVVQILDYKKITAYCSLYTSQQGRQVVDQALTDIFSSKHSTHQFPEPATT